ncbi:RIP metalloprotease RseP [Candidatus Poribacteria bacterium]|nr:MAG: RIP metalloprotease RseP [Candidatus Poribacteria bacterium]
MEFIQPILGIFPAIKGVLLAIIPLGFLIFIHELGHFLAAKRCGVKVNTFSLGFGPRLIGFEHGDTDYRLSLLPFGGYVQMEGETPGEQTGAEDEFASASVGKRAFIVIAGPVVNLLFGILAYWLVFTIGLDYNSAELVKGLTGVTFAETQAEGQVDNQEEVQIGWMAENSPAVKGGLLSGDVIVSINGENVNNWTTFQTIIFTSPEKELEFVINRNGNLKNLTIVPDVEPSARGDIGRISVSQTIEVIVNRLDEDSLAAQAGIQVGDKIETINGEKLYNVPFFEPGIWDPETKWIGRKYQELYQDIDNSDNLELGLNRYGEKITLQIPVQWKIKTRVQKGSTAENAGIMDDDVLISIDGKQINSQSLYTTMQSVSNYPFELGLLRNDTPITIAINPEESSRDDAEDSFFGIAWNTYLSGMKLTPLQMPLPKYNLIEAGGMGLHTTWLTSTSVTKLLKKLVSGQVSPKFLSGPVGIGTMTSEMFDRKIGMASILFFVGFISINLCIVNLLPIPIADGGQLLFFAMEKIRGRSLPQNAQAIIQQISVGLLLALFIYITWYDILSLIDRLSGN